MIWPSRSSLPVVLTSVARFFYRIVKSNPPTEDDFASNFSRGRRPRRSEILNPEEHRSISVYERREDALATQRLFPVLGAYLAELELADDEIEIAIHKADDNPNDSHYNLRGDPSLFLVRIRRVFPA